MRQMKDLVDVYFPRAYKIRVVLDNLNTHTPAALYQAFPPQEARANSRAVRVSLYSKTWQLVESSRN